MLYLCPDIKDMQPKYNLLLLVLCIILLNSCASIKTELYFAFINEPSGESVRLNEPNVRAFLESVYNSSDDFTMKVYMRTVFNLQRRRTRLMTHSYYFIINDETGDYYTLSFYGTDMTFHSRGSWILNSNSDLLSYRMFTRGSRRWDVGELFSEYNIDTRQTIANILVRMDSGYTYYYRDHIRDKPGVDNCNTALYETIVFLPRD